MAGCLTESTVPAEDRPYWSEVCVHTGPLVAPRFAVVHTVRAGWCLVLVVGCIELSAATEHSDGVRTVWAGWRVVARIGLPVAPDSAAARTAPLEHRLAAHTEPPAVLEFAVARNARDCDRCLATVHIGPPVVPGLAAESTVPVVQSPAAATATAYTAHWSASGFVAENTVQAAGQRLASYTAPPAAADSGADLADLVDSGADLVDSGTDLADSGVDLADLVAARSAAVGCAPEIFKI